VLAFTMDGHTLVAFITVTVAVVFIVVVIARMVKRDRDVRVTKIGVYVERDRFDAEDTHSIDPLDARSETRPPPLPPPTPPPPLPPRPDDETQSWPQREESP
jgi:hypothetical protein